MSCDLEIGSSTLEMPPDLDGFNALPIFWKTLDCFSASFKDLSSASSLFAALSYAASTDLVAIS